MAEMVMPRLSDTMEEGTILRWLKADGERVARGEELVEIETDKANMTYESDQEGVLQIVAHEGDSLAVGATIAHIGEDGSSAVHADAAAPAETAPAETAPAKTAPAKTAPAKTAPAKSIPSETASAEVTPSAPAEATPSAPAKAIQADEVTAAQASPSATVNAERVKASPVARRVAKENGIDLQALSGSGPGGRIVKADVEAAGRSASSATSAPPATASSAPMPRDVSTAKGESTTQELSRTQRAIARRMAESKATIPDFTLQLEIDMEECVALRSELKRLAQSPQYAQNADPTTAAGAPTYNDMVVKACALALREHPRANGSYRDGQFELHARVNVGVAVASEDALVVPTVFDADTKSLGEIARETRTLAQRVRAQTITPPELSGGTFTVSNLGMYGIRSFAAIVNPPQAAILSVGAVEPRAVVLPGDPDGAAAGDPDGATPGDPDGAGKIVARHTMAVTLACDHRILYGADAARFLARIRELLEAPAALTL
jgi:pyruvate dehydrogenase E2 component (dihydrolipoamide acetyltransferase)